MPMNKICIVIYTEGDTDDEFYKYLLEYMRSKIKLCRYNVKKIERICIKGIGNFQKKLVNKFKYDIYLNEKYENYKKIVFLCYDMDVFEYSKNPPINRNKIEKDLKAVGVQKVIHIKAHKSIEDILLCDIEGILSFLKIKASKNELPTGNGFKKMKFLFKKANRTYFKGKNVEGLLKRLDIKKICEANCAIFKPLCTILGVDICTEE